MPSLTSVSPGTVLVGAPPTPYRQGLLTTLQDTWPHLALTITADAERLPQLVQQQPFALVLLDSAITSHPLLPLIRQLHDIRRQQQVLVLTAGQLTADYQQDLLRLDAPLLPQHSSPAELVQAIRPWLSGATGGEQLPSARLRHATGPPTPLSRRELDVLRLIIDDCSNREIARQLSLSVRTVESHRRAMLQKAGVRTLIGLVVQAVREGWIAT